ncbi:MAG: arginine--tRNA ligase [Candidatus Omnitrophica bacterium]|nr:arginine--tRNA ligase [Candidatus Omnitrophota bacterium]
MVTVLKRSLEGLFSISDTRQFPVCLDIPKDFQHGDIATNMALQLSGTVKKPPMEIAEKIRAFFIEKSASDEVLSGAFDAVEVARPGFLNFRLSRKVLCAILREVHREGADFGRVDVGRGKKVQIEFVSANPTGPLTVAHGRQAAVGDALARILAFTGFKVTREYYLNDEGRQMELLGASIRARYCELTGCQAAFPEDGYKGEYIYDIARKLIEQKGDTLKDSDSLKPFIAFGCEEILDTIKQDLKEFDVEFDIYSSQAALIASGQIEEVLEQLKGRQFVYEAEGAMWFASSRFGDDKDRVVRKSDGEYTYLASDIAYHRDKFRRGFDIIVNIWGPDHHGYINRMKAAVRALGHSEDQIHILIIQLAKLFKGKEMIPMSTREGKFITLREVFEEVGVDTARYFFMMRRRESHLDFDLELAKKHSLENPVYYIQYAHARICSIFEYQANETGADWSVICPDDALMLLTSSEEVELMRKIHQFVESVRTAARQLDPCAITTYLLELAKAFHFFYTKHKVVGEDERVTAGRLFLIHCVKTVLANGLRLLGITAPAKM